MTGVQLELDIPAPNPQAFSLNGIVRSILLAHEWLSPYEIQRLVEARTGTWHSDSSVSARIRDLRKPAYGSHVIEKRKREGSKSFEYRIQA